MYGGEFGLGISDFWNLGVDGVGLLIVVFGMVLVSLGMQLEGRMCWCRFPGVLFFLFFERALWRGIRVDRAILWTVQFCGQYTIYNSEMVK